MHNLAQSFATHPPHSPSPLHPGSRGSQQQQIDAYCGAGQQTRPYFDMPSYEHSQTHARDNTGQSQDMHRLRMCYEPKVGSKEEQGTRTAHLPALGNHSLSATSGLQSDARNTTTRHTGRLPAYSQLVPSQVHFTSKSRGKQNPTETQWIGAEPYLSTHAHKDLSYRQPRAHSSDAGCRTVSSYGLSGSSQNFSYQGSRGCIQLEPGLQLPASMVALQSQ